MYKLLSKAIKHAGGQTALARRLSELTGERVTQSVVSTWLARSKKPGFRGVPAEYCYPIEKLTKGAVPADRLRPDVFGRLTPRRKK